MEVKYDAGCERCVFWETFACQGRILEEGKPYASCEREVSMLTDMSEYNRIISAFEKDCDEAMQPVKEKYRKLFEEYCFKDYTFEDGM